MSDKIKARMAVRQDFLDLCYNKEKPFVLVARKAVYEGLGINEATFSKAMVDGKMFGIPIPEPITRKPFLSWRPEAWIEWLEENFGLVVPVKNFDDEEQRQEAA